MELNQRLLCECGCGEPVRVTGRKKSKYRRGHNPGVESCWNEWEILSAMQAADANSYSAIKDEHEEIGVFIPSHYPDPEKTLLKKESYQLLSSEAKYVIDLCLNAPTEILEAITSPAKGLISRHRVTRFCAKKWKNSIKTRTVFQEIWEFVNNF